VEHAKVIDLMEALKAAWRRQIGKEGVIIDGKT
jgi:hypothetical protein